MELRYWLTEALSGTIGPEVRVQGSPQFGSRFGGGTFSADLMLGHLRTVTGGLDFRAINEVLSWADGGRYSITVTQGTDCAGEWLIWRTNPVDGDGPVGVSGFELDGYPAFRSLNDDYVGGNFDQLNLAARLLRDAFYSHQDFAITVPWIDSALGSNRTISYPSHSAYYDEVIEEISAPVDGFQWRVVPTVRWENHRPVRVEREVVYGEPELRRTYPTRLFSGGDGSRQGNLASFPRPARDFSKYAQSVYGWGRGEGAKQSWVGLSDPTLTNEGFLIVTKNVDFPDVSDQSLTALTRGELAAAQELREPLRATVLADGVPSIPRVGDVVDVQIGRSVAWPNGFEGSLQVGEVSLNPDGGRLNTFDLLAL